MLLNLAAAVCASVFAIAAVHAAPSIDLAQFRGRVVYLDFWASWCAPCRQSFPWMQAMQDAYGAQGLTVVAVNVDRSRTEAERFLADFHPTFDVRFDPGGELASRFKIRGMPAAVIIDRRGAPRYAHTGFRPVDGGNFEEQLRSMLAEK
jgi:thiol-disulfide isomerase/thioredoxin